MGRAPEVWEPSPVWWRRLEARARQWPEHLGAGEWLGSYLWSCSQDVTPASVFSNCWEWWKMQFQVPFGPVTQTSPLVSYLLRALIWLLSELLSRRAGERSVGNRLLTERGFSGEGGFILEMRLRLYSQAQSRERSPANMVELSKSAAWVGGGIIESCSL